MGPVRIYVNWCRGRKTVCYKLLNVCRCHGYRQCRSSHIATTAFLSLVFHPPTHSIRLLLLSFCFFALVLLLLLLLLSLFVALFGLSVNAHSPASERFRLDGCSRASSSSRRGVPNSRSPASPNPGRSTPSSVTVSSTAPTVISTSGWSLAICSSPVLDPTTDTTWILGTPHWMQMKMTRSDRYEETTMTVSVVFVQFVSQTQQSSDTFTCTTTNAMPTLVVHTHTHKRKSNSLPF